MCKRRELSLQKNFVSGNNFFEKNKFNRIKVDKINTLMLNSEQIFEGKETPVKIEKKKSLGNEFEIKIASSRNYQKNFSDRKIDLPSYDSTIDEGRKKNNYSFAEMAENLKKNLSPKVFGNFNNAKPPLNIKVIFI